MLDITNDPKTWEEYHCVGPSDDTENGEAILDFIDKSQYKSVKTYTIDFWFKKDNKNNEGQRLLEVTNNIKTITIYVYNTQISIISTNNEDGESEEIAILDRDFITQSTFNLCHEWYHFSFAFSEEENAMILHLNGNRLYATVIYDLILEEMHLYSHTKQDPIYFALIRISNKIQFPDETYDLEYVSKPYTSYVDNSETTEEIIENSVIKDIKDVRYFNGKIDNNTIIYQSFKSNIGNQSTGPLNSLFKVLPSSNTKIYNNKLIVDDTFWKNITGSIGPMSDLNEGKLQYTYVDGDWGGLSDWTIDFWFNRSFTSNKLTLLMSLNNNANTTFTEIYTKNTKLIIKTYDKTISAEYRLNTYYSIECQSDFIRTLKFDIDTDDIIAKNSIGEPIQNSLSLSKPFNINTWNHLALTYEENTNSLKLYLNGTLIFYLQEYIDYVLNDILLNANLLSANPTFFTGFRLSAVVQFDQNFDITEWKKYPYDSYASCISVERLVIKQPSDTLEDILDTGPKELPITYKAGGGYLPLSSQDVISENNTIYSTGGKGYYVPNSDLKNEIIIEKNNNQIAANSDIKTVTYYSSASTHYFPLNKDGTTNIYSLVELPFSKTIPDIFWNAITAKAGVKSTYIIKGTDVVKFTNDIDISTSNTQWNTRYAIGPTTLNSVNPSVVTLTSIGTLDNVWTCEFWFKRDTLDLTKSLDLFEVISSDSFHAVKVALTSDSIEYYINDANKNYFKESTRGNLNNLINTWNHFTMTYYSATSLATIYLNGQSIYTSTSIPVLLPFKINVYLQNHAYNNTLITDLKLYSGLKYAKSFDLGIVSKPKIVYTNITDMPRNVSVYKPPILDDPTQKLWVFNGRINDMVPLYFPIQGTNKDYDKESPIDYNTGIYNYDDPYLVEATNSKNYKDMLVRNDASWKGFNPIGPSQSNENGNIHVTNTSGHKSSTGKYTVEFWMYRGAKKSN